MPYLLFHLSWESQLALMETHNIIMAPLFFKFFKKFAGVTQIIGGIPALILNRYDVICALGFAAMTILINFIF